MNGIECKKFTTHWTCPGELWKDAPDGIGTVSADPVATDSYTLNGIRLQGAPAQRGVYIRNGRKMIVK